MEQHEGFSALGKENKVCRLEKKSIYGLKHAPKKWHKSLIVPCRKMNLKSMNLINVSM